MSDRWTPDSLADRLSRLVFAVDAFNRDVVRAYCDEVQALQDQCTSLIREREALRAEVTRLECGPWVQCGYCNHTVYVNAAKTCPKCGTEVTYG